LRSRVQLIHLIPLEPEVIRIGLERAAEALEIGVDDDALAWISLRTGGDLRLAYTTLESAALMARAVERDVTVDDTRLCLTQTQLSGDRDGDNHYDLASAFQKSLRGSDDNAAIYYLARFIETGEDPRFIARRLLVTAAEDVGNADPTALAVASAAFRAVEVLGMPECRIPLAQATLYVARAPKSNEAITALSRAREHLINHPLPSIPDHLRDSHYKGAAELGFGEDYIYSHNRPGQGQKFIPSEVGGEIFVSPPSAKPAPRSAPGEEIDRAELEQALREMAGDETWFAIDTEKLAEMLGAKPATVRSWVNKLVQDQTIAFKRLFSFSDRDRD